MIKNKKLAITMLWISPLTLPELVLAGQWGNENWGTLEWEELLMNIPVPLFYSFVLLGAFICIRKFLNK